MRMKDVYTPKKNVLHIYVSTFFSLGQFLYSMALLLLTSFN